MEPICSIPHL